MFGFSQFASDAIHVGNPLCWVVMTQNLSVELAQALGFFFRKFIVGEENANLFR